MDGESDSNRDLFYFSHCERLLTGLSDAEAAALMETYRIDETGCCQYPSKRNTVKMEIFVRLSVGMATPEFRICRIQTISDPNPTVYPTFESGNIYCDISLLRYH